MFFALRVGEVGAFIGVQSQAESAFERAEMVAEDVRILGQVYGLQGKFPQTLTAVDVGLGRASDTTTAKLGADSILRRLSIDSFLIG